MRWHRSASLLSLLVFLAFGFMLIGVFSDPLSNGVISIASRDGYNYGILGYCETADTKKCSGYSLGYTLQGLFTNWGTVRHNLTKAFILHIIAAGVLFITLILVLFAHFRSPSLMVAVICFANLSFITSIVAFVIEIYVFRTHLKFSGWFGLPAAILSLVAVIGSGITHRRLKDEEDRSLGAEGKVTFLGNDGMFFKDNGNIIGGNDDEKPLKANIATSLGGIPSGFQGTNADNYYNNNSNNGFYAGGPQRSNPSNNPQNRYANATNVKSQFTPQANRAYPSQYTNNRNVGMENFGAVSNGQTHNEEQYSTEPASTYGATQAAYNGYQKYKVPRDLAANPRQNTWSQAALQMEQAKSQHPDTSTSADPVVQIPAGQYVRGVENTERYGPNVVQIPKVGDNDPRQGDLDTIKDTQIKPPVHQTKVPNFSRMSVQGQKIGADRYADPNSTQYYNSKSSEQVEGGYSGFSNIPHSGSAHSNLSGKRHLNTTDSNANVNANYSSTLDPSKNQYDTSQSKLYRTEPGSSSEAKQYFTHTGQSQQASSYLPTQQKRYDIPQSQSREYETYQNYQQSSYAPSTNSQGYQNSYEHQHQQGFHQPGFQSYNHQPGFGGSQFYPGQPTGKDSNSRFPTGNEPFSSVMLQNNPDFSVGNLGKKVRPNRRRP